MPSKTDALSFLRTSITKLDSKLQMFSNEIEQVFDDLQNNVTVRTNELEDEANNLTNISNRVHQIQAAVEMRISKHEYSLGAQFVEYTLNITNQLNILMQETYIYISSARAAAHTSVDELTTKMVRDIQELHVFESWNAINTFSLPFSSGEYMIRASPESTRMNCTLFSCKGMTGGWRRVAYLNTIKNNTMPPQCPPGLGARNDPPSCRSNIINEGCASVMYPVEGAYRCIFGRIIARQSGDPDGFTNPQSQLRNGNPTLEGNYADGVSLTYGSPKKHIWTFTAAISFSSTEDCSRCEVNIPSMIVGTDYTCDVLFQRCGNDGLAVCTDSLWDGNGGTCPSNATFYRELPESTTDNIEMRVCRDQDRTDEDFLITFVEIYVV